MQRVLSPKALLVLSLAAGLSAAAACAPPADDGPVAGAADVTLSSDSAPIGSPLEMTYRFTLEPDAAPIGPRRVFVHFLDADEERMWADDHDPPTPTTEWQPGQTVEYTRTVFLPVYPYTGATQVVIGLHTPGSNDPEDRVRLSNQDRGDRSYEVARFDLQPQSENIFVIFKDGWHAAEVTGSGPGEEWQWTRKEATLSFRNPRQDVMFYLQADNPSSAASAARHVEVRIGEQTLATLALADRDAPIHKVPIAAAQLGDGEMVEIRLVAETTFVPALVSGTTSTDSRELGVRVFHAFVEPR